MLWDVWVMDLEIEAFYLTVEGLSFEKFKETQNAWDDTNSVLIAIPAGCLLVRNPLLGDDCGNRLKCIE